MGSDVVAVRMGDVAFEVTERKGDKTGPERVFGVQKGVGLTAETRYSANDLSRYKVIHPGDFAYNPMRLNIGSIGLCRKEMGSGLVSPDYVAFRVGPMVLPEFLAYYTEMFAWTEWVERAGGGSVRTRIYFFDLAEMPIYLPPLHRQRAAVATLQVLDHRIAELGRTNASLEAIAQALFKSWFVDFDPVRAKAEGREPHGMDVVTAALFPSELQESEMGPTPAGWNIGTLADVSDLNVSKWNARNPPVSVRYIDLGGVRNNRIDPPSELPFSEAPSRARQRLREGDTIVGTVRPGNRAFAYIHQPEDNLTGSTGFAVLSPRSPEDSSFVYLAATCDPAIDRLTSLADGAAYPAVRPAVVSNTPCVIPPQNVLKAFAGLTKPLLERITQNSITAHTLANLRDTLLPRLISGTLSIPEAEKVAADV